MHPLESLLPFRHPSYQSSPTVRQALFEIIDAVAHMARPHSPVGLSLVLQRHWLTLDDALDEGAIAEVLSCFETPRVRIRVSFRSLSVNTFLKIASVEGWSAVSTQTVPGKRYSRTSSTISVGYSK